MSSAVGVSYRLEEDVVRVVAIIQARMGSTRLPGKVLAPLAGRPVLGWVTRALQSCGQIDEVVVATTTEGSDDPIERYAAEGPVRCVRGPEDDVLARYLLALDAAPADAVVRITADCPLIDPALVDLVAAAWRHDPTWDYVATTLHRSLPRGLDVELVSSVTLRGLDAVATDHHRRHVTSHLYTVPEGRRLLGLVVSPPADDLRVTLDTEQDWELLEAVTAHVGDRIIAWHELVDYLRGNPDVVRINAAVQQKPLEAG